MGAKERYSGLQTLLEDCGKYGCLFLCLLSIAEEMTGKRYDIITTIHLCMTKGWLSKDFFVNDNLSILEELTGVKWSRRTVSSLPTIGERDYTVVKYYNEKTKYTHFKRRGYDTLVYSKTVAEGRIEGYYIYSWS